MSNAAAAAAAVSPVDDAAAKKPRRKLSKKMLVIVLAAVLLLAVAGGAGFFVWKKRAAAKAAAEAAEAGEDGPVATAVVAHERPKTPPAYVPLDAFTINLADKEAERFAQIAVTFELTDAHATDEVKNYMPSIRNAILLILTHKTSTELLGREGKEQLAREIARGASIAMGYPVADEAAAAAHGAEEAASSAKKAAKPAAEKKPADAHDESPIRRVHFANFIIQ